MRGEIIEFFIIKQIKKPRHVLCSVIKHLGSGRALKKWGKTLDCVSCFTLHFYTAQSRLLYLLIKDIVRLRRQVGETHNQEGGGVSREISGLVITTSVTSRHT